MFIWFVVSTFLLIIHFSSKGPLGSSWWVKVGYLDEEKKPQTIYFANKWAGISRGTRQMYTYLKQEFSIDAS